MDYHKPVLLNEVIDSLKPLPGKVYIDATVGNGGHSLELIKHGAIVYGFDVDINNLNLATKRIVSSNFYPVNKNFTAIKNVCQNMIRGQVDGILADLGLSSNQQSQPGRGFSFNDPGSIDMRLDTSSQKVSAESIINTYDENDLYLLFSKLAQEPYSRPLAQRIIKARQKSPIKTGQQLAQIIRDYYQTKRYNRKIDPSTKVFMALRIETNNEFENLKSLLDQSLKVVKKGGVIDIISFHSGEDRIVKNFIKKNNLVNKRYLPSQQEIKDNHLARSAILRAYTVN